MRFPSWLLVAGVTLTPAFACAQTSPGTPPPVPARPPPTQGGPALSPAPVPNIVPEQVAPADRAGGPGLRSSNAGPTDSTPFSAAPTGTLRSGDQVDRHTRDDGPSAGETTPNLGR